MNRINIPRFTAEASLYRTRGQCLPAGQAIESSRSMSSVYPAMMDDGGVNCGNCLGGECAELHCFENWTHGGGGPGGPYEGGGGGPHGGGTRSGCVSPRGRHGTSRTTTIVRPPGGPENTYVIRQRCQDGAWIDQPY